LKNREIRKFSVRFTKNHEISLETFSVQSGNFGKKFNRTAKLKYHKIHIFAQTAKLK